MSADLTKAAERHLVMPPFRPVLVIIFLGSFIGMYHIVSLNVALPGFIGIFHSDLGTVQWIVTGFTLACGIIAPASGYAIDRFGGRRLFLFTLAGITASSLLCAVSWSIGSLIGFRLIQGLFCGLMQPLSLAMIYRAIPREKQPFAVSVWSFSTVLGTSIGPTLSGWLQNHDWHLIFLVTVPLGIAAYIAAAIVLPRDAGSPEAKLDVTGLLLATAASLALLLLFGSMHEWGLFSIWSCSLLAVGLLCGSLFVRHELKTDRPLLQLRLFANPVFSFSLAVSLLLSFALYAGVYFTPLYLEEILGLSPFQAGLVFLPAAACLTLATLFSGKYYGKFGAAALILAGSLILLVTTYRFSLLSPGTALLTIILWLCLRNAGTGLAMSPATNAGMSAIPDELLSHASALLNWLRQVFSAMALGLSTSLFYVRMAVHEGRLAVQEGAESETALHKTAYMLSINDAFLIASILVTLAIPLSLILRRMMAGNKLPSAQEKQA